MKYCVIFDRALTGLPIVIFVMMNVPHGKCLVVDQDCYIPGNFVSNHTYLWRTKYFCVEQDILCHTSEIIRHSSWFLLWSLALRMDHGFLYVMFMFILLNDSCLASLVKWRWIFLFYIMFIYDYVAISNCLTSNIRFYIAYCHSPKMQLSVFIWVR